MLEDTVKTLVLAAAASGLLVADSWPGQFLSGNDLFKKCTSDGTVDGHFCLGYVMGVADELELLRSVDGKPPCIAQGVTIGQVKDVVVAELKASPETRHFNAAFLTTGAVAKAWHCPLIRFC
jgi:hypothetical protein